MTVADHNTRFHSGGLGPNLDQNHNCRRRRDRSRRMHGNAELAMVGIGLQRMHMRHLNHREQRQ